MESSGHIPGNSADAIHRMAAATPVGDCVNAPIRIVSLALVLFSALPARAGTYFVTVAGLGGEPDYEQRFAAAATDLDRVLKSSGELAFPCVACMQLAASTCSASGITLRSCSRRYSFSRP